MAERVDLDGWQDLVDWWRRADSPTVQSGITVHGLARLVSELRVAREVVEAANRAASSPWPRTAIAEMRPALAAYDRQVQPGDDPGSGG